MSSDLHHRTTPKRALLARCLLKEARDIFAYRGWKQLPQTERGRAILIWGADHAWLASSGNPKRSVERWCKRWAPWLTDAELRALIADTVTSNKRWSTDQSAIVLEISLAERTARNLRHIGANDDPNYDARRSINRRKTAERSRKYRAKHSTGAKPGRPSLNLSPDERIARQREQKAASARRRRATENPSRHLKEIDRVTELNSTHSPASPRSRPVDIEAPASPRTPSHRQASCLNQPQEQQAIVSDVAADHAAPNGLERERLQSRERARLHLNEVMAQVMCSDDPASWQPRLIAATSEWRRHSLLDDDDHAHAYEPRG
ncbi:hypothetical protein [Bradyrhizobium sp. LB11.1]|uniref:hypothetical protein n=1 Tax=Bradyrhizobium sp. LB11.1 TaxID=3156326 RepID=UPI00339712DE